MNDEFERNWKEVFMACIKILSRDLSGGTEENHENFRIVGALAKILTWYLLITSQNHYHLSQISQ
jgi:hypothetical protein